MSKYLILIFQDEAVARQAEGESISPSYQEFMQRRNGSLLSGAALHPASTATSIRRDGSGGQRHRWLCHAREGPAPSLSE